MAAAIQAGDFVNVVATIDLSKGEGKIRYVNPSSSTVVSDAPTDPDVELVVTGAGGQQLYKSEVVVRRSSPDPARPNDVGLIQADLPKQSGMKSVSLLYKGKEVSRYDAGELPAAAAAGGLALSPAAGLSPNRRDLSLSGLANRGPRPGVSYSVQVKAEPGGPWNTIAVGRPTPAVELDRNQFPGAERATVRVLMTTGFDEAVIAEETIDLTE